MICRSTLVLRVLPLLSEICLPVSCQNSLRLVLCYLSSKSYGTCGFTRQHAVRDRFDLLARFQSVQPSRAVLQCYQKPYVRRAERPVGECLAFSGARQHQRSVEIFYSDDIPILRGQYQVRAVHRCREGLTRYGRPPPEGFRERHVHQGRYREPRGCCRQCSTA